MGFFNGPQIEGYAGYAKYLYGLETHLADQYTEISFSGALLGIRGTIPIYDKIRIYTLFDFLLTSSYSEFVRILGPGTAISNYRIEFGGQYMYLPNQIFSGGLSILSNNANFASGTIKQMQFMDVALKIGALTTF